MRKDGLLSLTAIATAIAAILFGLAACFTLVTKLVVIVPVSVSNYLVIILSTASLGIGLIITFTQKLAKQVTKSSSETRKYPIQITLKVDEVVIKMEFPTEEEVKNVLELLKRLSLRNLSISGRGALRSSLLEEYKNSLEFLDSEERLIRELRLVGYPRVGQGRGSLTSPLRRKKKIASSSTERGAEKDKIDDKV